MESAIFAGVFSGVITSAIIWLCIKVINEIFIPWYQNYIYKGLDFSGTWISNLEFGGGVQSQITVELKQKGHKLTGSLTSMNKIPSEGDGTTMFNLVGEAFDNYIDIEYKANNKKIIGRGSMFLKIKDGGSKLHGSLIAIDRFTLNIMSSDNIILSRRQ